MLSPRVVAQELSLPLSSSLLRDVNADFNRIPCFLRGCRTDYRTGHVHFSRFLYPYSLFLFFFPFIFYEQRSNFSKDTLFFVSHVQFMNIRVYEYTLKRNFFWLNFWRKEIGMQKSHRIKISVRQKREAHRNGIRINKCLSVVARRLDSRNRSFRSFRGSWQAEVVERFPFHRSSHWLLWIGVCAPTCSAIGKLRELDSVTSAGRTVLPWLDT